MAALRKREPTFATEAEMCAEFIARIGPDWIAYAETEGWDILLVRKADGFQIGIEAKLKLNAEVICQALESNKWHVDMAGPDCRAIMVPASDTGAFDTIAAYAALTVVRVQKPHNGIRQVPFSPGLPKIGDGWTEDRWHEQFPTKRHRLPEYVPDVAAGASAPVQLTQWKIAAIKIAIILETRGFVQRSDFKAVDIDHRRWMSTGQGWLIPGKHGYVAGPRLPDFKGQHPVVFEQIRADAPKWMPPALAAAPVQQRML